MGASYLSNPLIFLIETLFGLYILAFMLRFLLAIVRADFYNPVSQFLVKITNPLLKPLRHVIPAVGKMDTSALIIMLALQMISLLLVYLLQDISPKPGWLLVRSLIDLLNLFMNVFLYAILIQVILSWVNPGNYNPVSTILHSLTEPVLSPCRRLLPPISGFIFRLSSP